jgi:hypothetical protein
MKSQTRNSKQIMRMNIKFKEEISVRLNEFKVDTNKELKKMTVQDMKGI